MPMIRTFLTFDRAAEEAAHFYVSLFANSRIAHVTRYGDAGPGPKGHAMVVEFELDGRPFCAMNGGPHFQFSEAISLSVDCDTQAEIDRYWKALSEGGQTSRCGWLKDRFGVSWQVVPARMAQWMGDPDPARAQRVMEAMLKLDKLEIETLERAHRGA